MDEAASIDPQLITRIPCSVGTLLSFSWGVGSEIRLCEVRHPATGTGGHEPAISTVLWNVPSTSHRALAYAVAPAHDDLQRARLEGSSHPIINAIHAKVLKYSRTVRECLLKEREGEDGNLISLEVAIWHLLELFFLDSLGSEGFIAEDMVCWLAHHGAVVDMLTGRQSLQARMDQVLLSVRPDALADYWPLMQHLVAMGRIQDALQLLDAHDCLKSLQQQSETPAPMLPQFELLDALYVVLRQMPRFKRAGSDGSTGREFDNMAEFLYYRSTWQQQCQLLPEQCSELFDGCAAVSPKTAEGVRKVLAVLGGDEPAIAATASNWVELAVAEMVHLHPNLKAQQHLAELMLRCRRAQPFTQDQHVLELLYSLCEAAVEMEAQRVVEVLSSSGAVSPWFMSHIYDVLQAYPRTSSVVERPLPLFDGDQVEYWRLMFAESLMHSPATWRLAIQYLAWCPLHGAEATELLLETLPVGSSEQRLVEQALQVCETHGLSSTAIVLSRMMGAGAWYGGRLAEAVRWLASARDGSRLAAALAPVISEVHALLKSNLGRYQAAPLLLAEGNELQALLAAVTGSFSINIVEPSAAPSSTPGAAAGASSRQLQEHASLVFLQGFLKLQQATAQVDQAAADAADADAAYKAVRDAFMSLATSGAVPPQLGLPLLLFIVPAMEAGQLQFSTDDVQTLLRWLLDIVLSHRADEFAAGMHERHVKDVQLALARSLVRAHTTKAAITSKA